MDQPQPVPKGLNKLTAISGVIQWTGDWVSECSRNNEGDLLFDGGGGGFKHHWRKLRQNFSNDDPSKLVDICISAVNPPSVCHGSKSGSNRGTWQVDNRRRSGKSLCCIHLAWCCHQFCCSVPFYGPSPMDGGQQLGLVFMLLFTQPHHIYF